MASEIDLPWTYVGGPRGLIDAVVADKRIEALPAGPDDLVSRVEGWVSGWIDDLADGLLRRGRADLRTPRGTIAARLRRPGLLRKGELRIEATGRGGYGSFASHALRDAAEVQHDLTLYLTLAVLGLAGM